MREHFHHFALFSIVCVPSHIQQTFVRTQTYSVIRDISTKYEMSQIKLILWNYLTKTNLLIQAFWVFFACGPNAHWQTTEILQKSGDVDGVKIRNRELVFRKYSSWIWKRVGFNWPYNLSNLFLMLTVQYSLYLTLEKHYVKKRNICYLLFESEHGELSFYCNRLREVSLLLCNISKHFFCSIL